jgi:hypothetical protein
MRGERNGLVETRNMDIERLQRGNYKRKLPHVLLAD